MIQKTKIAAIDLGSNSFRLELFQWQHGLLERLEYIKDTVRLGSGLDEDRCLTPETMQRGWDCLQRFAERIKNYSSADVVAVATQTLREARNREVFLLRARTILGFPIEVISGQEEARLIYKGVCHFLPPNDQGRLVIDVGGRSTELSLGKGSRPEQMESFRVGSVSLSIKCFAEGELSKEAFHWADIVAKSVLDAGAETFQPNAWDCVYGASGTVGAIADIIMAKRQAEMTTNFAITRKDLLAIRQDMLQAKHIKHLKLPGLKEERKPVVAGGLAILLALFDLYRIETLYAAEGALRHGLACDLLERRKIMNQATVQSDQQSASIERLQLKFSVELAQAQRVSSVALNLFKHLKASLTPHLGSEAFEAAERSLNWAAQLHEIGAHISHTDSHKHGAYIIDNSDALGFTLNELHGLSLLVLGHKGKLQKIIADYDDVAWAAPLLCLRLAVLFCHARAEPDLQKFSLIYLGARQCELGLPAKWAEQFPQSAHLLQNEVKAWQKIGWQLNLTQIN